MKRPQLVSQGSLSRLLKTAEESLGKRDFPRCIEILERASRLAPADITVLLQLGRAHGYVYGFKAAEECFEKAVRLAPQKAVTLAAAAEHARDFRGSNLSDRYFERVLEHKDVPADVLARVAEHFERVRRPAEASKLVDRALALSKTCAPALLVQARLQRQAGDLDQAEKLLRSMLNLVGHSVQAGPERDVRIRGWYELGAVLDRQKRFDEAMTAFLEAKSVIRLDAGPHLADLKIMRQRLDDLQKTISRRDFDQWSGSASGQEPAGRLTLLAGHPRSGTTLLEQVLDSHPDVISAEETEIFLDQAYHPLTREFPPETPVLKILESASPASLTSGRRDYFRTMELALGGPVAGRLLIDKNPSYTFLVPALVRFFPEIKLLIALRDPRDVVLSCFMQSFVPLGQTSAAYLTLERAVDEYVALMGMWRTTAPLLNNPWLEVRYEDMVEDLESVSRRVLNFLELSWDASVLHFDEHARQKTVRSPTYADVTRPVFKTAMGRWRNYQKYFEPHLAKLEPFAKAFGYEL